MKYLLSQEELDELKAEHEPVSDKEKYEEVFRLIMAADFMTIEVDQSSGFNELLKLVIKTNKLPRDLLNYIKESRR